MTRRILAAQVLALLLSFSTFARQNAPTTQLVEPDDEVVELETTLVEVPVTVSEPGGRYVVDLAQSDFKIFEDGVEQHIDVFSAVDQPFNVALMIDTSGSTRDQLDRIKEAASAFLDQLRPHDRVALIAFEDDVKVLSPLTSDRNKLRRALQGLAPGQYTQVYEAMHVVAEDVLAKVQGRKAAILFSDGVDTASAIATFDDSLAEISRRRAIVYPIRYNTRPDVEARLGIASRAVAAADDPAGRARRVEDSTAASEKVASDLADVYHKADAYLYTLADQTGGVLYRADTLDDLPSVFARIADELRHQYLIGYYPPKRDDATAQRRISVQISRSGLKVRARESYVSQPER